MKLEQEYYRSTDVVALSRDCIGKFLFSRIDGKLTGGRIVETEAYAGVTDKASHAWGGRRTNRTSVMYREGGIGYVYLCYGIHYLFNIITGPADVPHAILIRAVEPLCGIEHMLDRRNQDRIRRNTSGGPGLVSQALGISSLQNGVDLTGGEVWIEDRGETAHPGEIISSCRVGVDYAGKDAEKPWRFRLKENRFTSPAR